MRLVGVIEQSPNGSNATEVFVRRPIFRMSPGLAKTSVALPPSTAAEEDAAHAKIYLYSLNRFVYYAN